MPPENTPREISGELPVRVVTAGSVVKRFFAAIGLVVLAAFWLVLGIIVLALTIAIVVVAGLGFLLWWVWALLVNSWFHLLHRRYPVSFRFPLGPRRARLVLRDAANSSVGTTLAAAARGTILFLGPLIFLL